MASKPLNFRERDVRAAMHAVEKTGKTIHAVEVDSNGTIRILLHPQVAEKQGRGWDDV